MNTNTNTNNKSNTKNTKENRNRGKKRTYSEMMETNEKFTVSKRRKLEAPPAPKKKPRVDKNVFSKHVSKTQSIFPFDKVVRNLCKDFEKTSI